MTVELGRLTIDWFGYATVRLATPAVTVYVDPGRYGVLTGEWTGNSEAAAAAHPVSQNRRPQDGDLVCVTHVHHYDPDGIDRVASGDATVLVFDGLSVHDTDRTDVRPVDVPHEVRRVGMEDELVAADVPVWTVPAYNEADGPHTRADGTPYHPRGFGCGFVFTLGDRRVCWPGDTDVLDGHTELDVDVFLPPIGGSFTMDRREAAGLAAAMAPQLVVPVHYNTFDALETDDRAFAADVAAAGVPVALDRQRSRQ
jgi:L-ascorbate metabolism protein UlaG (beta-lactamase superfamily)